MRVRLVGSVVIAALAGLAAAIPRLPAGWRWLSLGVAVFMVFAAYTAHLLLREKQTQARPMLRAGLALYAVSIAIAILVQSGEILVTVSYASFTVIIVMLQYKGIDRYLRK
jgi:hypothetical protein